MAAQVIKLFNYFLLKTSLQEVYVSNTLCMTTVYSKSLNRSLIKKIVLQRQYQAENTPVFSLLT